MVLFSVYIIMNIHTSLEHLVSQNWNILILYVLDNIHDHTHGIGALL